MTDSMLMQKDPVTFEVVRGGLYAICEEMKSVMMRASFSPLLSLSADLSCAILDQKGDVVAQGSDMFILGPCRSPPRESSKPFLGDLAAR